MKKLSGRPQDLLDIASLKNEIGYIDAVILKDMDDRCQALGKMLGSLIKARTPNP